MPAEEAGRAIHRLLLDTVLRNENGVRRDLDTEFLHDFRVATRRARCALAEMKQVFAAEAVQFLKQELKWLGTTTGPVRDMDVYLLKMDEYRAELPTDAGKHLEPLNDYLHRHHESERRKLIEALDGDRYRELVARWKKFVERRPRDDASCPNLARPIFSLASERIWRTYRRVYKDGRAIDATTPADALHELRIMCKRLRYLLEFFRSLYPPEPMLQLIGALKQLQDNLGDFNDFEVQQVKLRTFAEEMHEEGLASVDSLIAIGSLVQYLRQRQSEERERFAQCFKEFARRRQRALFRELFKEESMDALVSEELWE
jgi:CHAD domain-containing protein